MKKLRVSVASSISGAGITILRIIMPIYIEFIRPYADYILAFAISLIISPWLLMFVDFLKNKKPIKEQPPKQPINNFEDSKTLFGKIATLYSQTGILIQNSFDIPIAVVGGESQSLHKDFQDFTKYMDTIILSIPQEIGVKIMSFFDLLFDYKKQADVMINSSKTKERYDQWLDLKQRHEKIVAPRYTELEVYFRNILNENNPT